MICVIRVRELCYGARSGLDSIEEFRALGSGLFVSDVRVPFAKVWRGDCSLLINLFANRWRRVWSGDDGESRGAAERPGQEFVDPGLRVTGCDRFERRCHPGVGLHAVDLAGGDERSYARP